MAFNPQPKQGIKKKEPKPLKRSPLKKKFKATGEMETFQAVIAELPDTVTRCFVCDERITLVTHSNFAHILSKKQYPDFRNNPDNIRILCFKPIADENGNGCHFLYDHTPHSNLKGEGWEKLFKLRNELIEQYKTKL